MLNNFTRLHSLIFLTLFLMGLFVVMNAISWTGSVASHGLLEISSAILAFVIGAMALVNYHSRANKKYLLMGYGFIAISFLDGYAAIQTTTLIANTELALMISWSWFVSKTFLVLLLIANCSLFRKNNVTSFNITSKPVAAVAIIGLLLSILFLHQVSLPEAYYPEYLIHRPWESIPTILFLTVLVVSYRSDNWKYKYFEYSLFAAIIINIFSHIMFMSASTQFFDTAFNFAYLLKLLGYSCIFTGLLTVMYVRSKQVATESGNRKKAQDALIKSESQHRAIFSTMADGLITINKKGTIESFNKSAEKIFGYRLLEVLGRNINMLIPDPHHDRHDEYIDNYIKTGVAKLMGSSNVVEGKRKDQSLFPIELSLGETKLGDEKIFHGVVRDITKRKQTEEALILARSDAEKSARVKSDFLATMSHEIRTPMNGVLGMLELLQDTNVNSQQQDYLNIATSSGEALMAIINDILDFSKIESGKFELENIEFNLEIIGYDICSLLKAKTREKNIELILYYHNDCPVNYLGDPGRVRQIILNMVGNAIKFTSKGRIIVEIMSVLSVNGISTTKISIQDNGIGIDQEAQAKLFDSFTQADSSTSRRFGGIGLGLAICKNLVRLMGGIINVESIPNEGSTFSFTLHLPVIKTTAVNPNFEPEMASLKNMRVLIVDHCDLGQMIIKEHCMAWGMSVDTITTSKDAKQKLLQAVIENKPYQLVFIDKDLPDQSGDRLSRDIKVDNLLVNISLIAVTSVVTMGDSQYFEAAGFSALLNKPFLRETLFNTLVKIISNNKQQLSKKFITQHSLNELSSSNNYNIQFAGKILLVEDVIVNQKVAIGLLKKCGLIPDIANNGVEAIKQWMDNDYDVILMDCQMPELDGYEASQYIRKHEKETGQDTHTTIIALTAHSLITDRKKCIDAGMDDYLSKPFNFKQLTGILQKWLPEIELESSEVEEQTIEIVTETSAEVNSVIDVEILATLKNSVGEIFNEIIPAYIEQSDQMLNDIENLLSRGDHKTVERYAHSIKSSSYNVGAINLSNIARILEEKTRGGTDTALLTTHISSLKQEYVLVKTALNNYQ